MVYNLDTIRYRYNHIYRYVYIDMYIYIQTYIHTYIHTYIQIDICSVIFAMQFLKISFGWIVGLPPHSEERRKKRAGSKRNGGERKKRSDAWSHVAIHSKLWSIFYPTGWFTANM